MSRLALFAAALTLAPVSAAGSQSSTPQEAATLAWLHGSWRGEGKFMGRPANVELDIAQGLAGTATVLDYRLEAPASAASPALRFLARATYRITPDGKINGQWSDSGGNLHPLAGKVTGTSMAVRWGRVETELGHSRYVLGPDETLTVTDTVYTNGTARDFATATYRRTR